jgi:hypothetical protein
MPNGPDPDTADLVLRGRVVEIVPRTGSSGQPRWLVTVAVEQVTEGSFSGDRFAFVVHSPVKSGLAQGGVYTFRAKRGADGYTVDPLPGLPKP